MASRRRTPAASTNGHRAPTPAAEPQINAEAVLQENAQLSERLAALELTLENLDWRLLTMQSQYEFSREGLRAISELARVFAIKNPLIKRGIEVQRLYVWGQGWSVRAADDLIQQVVQAFIDDPKNQIELTGHQARMQKESELQIDGNLFLVFFVNQVTGGVRLRSIPFEEIGDIITDPDDAKAPWYYRRVWTEQRLTDSGAIEQQQHTAYYPDWRYNPTARRPDIQGYPVMWDTPIRHIKMGGFSNWKFGVSEIYAAIDWSRAYKEFLEDWASIVRAYRRFAFQLTTPGGKSAIAAAKTKLNTTVGTGGSTYNGLDTNPPPVAGSIFISSPDVSLQPVRTQGATVSAEDGRRILLMVAAAVGLPETFFGDVSVGTLATANSLDRPTELAMRDRQTLWAGIFGEIFDYVLAWAVKAPNGPLRGLGTLVRMVEDGQIEEAIDWGETDCRVDVDFPPIISDAMRDQVASIISAGTLDGRQLAGTIDVVELTRMLLVALGEDDVDEIMEKLFPGGVVPDWAKPETIAAQRQEMAQQRQNFAAQAAAREAAGEIRDKLVRLWGVS